MRTPNNGTGAKAGGRRQLLRRTRWAHAAQFRRWTQTVRISLSSVSLSLIFWLTACASTPTTLAPRTTAGQKQSARPEAAWPQPPDVPIFGVREADAVLVYVLGEVKQPGGYYLRRPAHVREAVAAAGGTGDFAWWKIYSGILRHHPFRLPSVIRFEDRQRAESINLQERDQVFFGHEVY